jgi:phospholipid/cholesterol/gamma-HCH transport system substrate-binding protein
LFSKRYELIAYLADANGLREGGSVMVAGQLAGSVKKIEFLPVDMDTTRNLRLTLAVDATVREQIRRDSRGKLRTMGLLGDKVFDITPGTPRFAVLQEGDTVTVEPTLDYEAVIAKASGAVDDMVGLTRDMRAITAGIVSGKGTVGQLVTNRALYDQLNGTLARANQMLAQLQNPNGTVGRMLNDPTLYNRLSSVIGSTDSLVISLNSSKGTAGLLLRDTTLYTNMVGITRGADSLMKTLTGGQGTASRLLTDQTLYDQLNKLVTDLSAILADVRRDPGRYTKGLIKVF